MADLRLFVEQVLEIDGFPEELLLVLSVKVYYLDIRAQLYVVENALLEDLHVSLLVLGLLATA
jgi:hypothetical protein